MNAAYRTAKIVNSLLEISKIRLGHRDPSIAFPQLDVRLPKNA